MPVSAGPNRNVEAVNRGTADRDGIAVFVMSCDKTLDVARHFIAAFRKYWPDCPYPIYFGINREQSHLASLAAIPLPSEIKGWKGETLDQLRTLRRLAPNMTHALVFLDDFVLSKKVDTSRIRRVLSDAVTKGATYLRLRRLEESIPGRLLQRFATQYVFGKESCIKIRFSHPYYASLQVALWRLDHLNTLLERSDNIWMFERMKDRETTHYAVLKSLIEYRHVVEKGEWDVTAEAHCRKALGWFNHGARPRRGNNFRTRTAGLLNRVRFALFGYLPMRLRKQVHRRGQGARS
jgi:hypothetical protein